jgi:hypothetical protein
MIDDEDDGYAAFANGESAIPVDVCVLLLVSTTVLSLILGDVRPNLVKTQANSSFCSTTRLEDGLFETTLLLHETLRAARQREQSRSCI